MGDHTNGPAGASRHRSQVDNMRTTAGHTGHDRTHRHLAWSCQTSRRSAGASTRKSFSARGALRLTSRKQPDSDAARLRRGKGLVHHARLGHRSTTIFCQSWRSQPPGSCVFAEGKDLWLDGASGTAAPSSSAIVGGHNHRGRVHLPRRVGARRAACFWREKADERLFKTVCLRRIELKKRFLLFDRLPAALAPHTRASGRSRGPDTTQKPHRSREKMVSWPSAAFGIGGRPRRVASPAPGVRKIHSRDFGGSEERLL